MTFSHRSETISFLVLSMAFTFAGCGDSSSGIDSIASGGSTIASTGGGSTIASSSGGATVTGTSGIVPIGGSTHSGTASSVGGAGSTAVSVSAMPAVGEGMITNWTTTPYLFGPWFTYGWAATGTSCTPEPATGIAATAQGMCINWSSCGTNGQGVAVGFKVCAAPAYPNESGKSDWFPFACTGSNADSCIPSETAKPISFCKGNIKGVSFAALDQSVQVAFLNAEGPNGTVIETVTVAPGTTTASLKGDGSAVAAIHFKIANPSATGQLCVSNVNILE